MFKNNTNFVKSSKKITEMIKSELFNIQNTQKLDEEQVKLEPLKISDLNVLTGGSGFPNDIAVISAPKTGVIRTTFKF